MRQWPDLNQSSLVVTSSISGRNLDKHLHGLIIFLGIEMRTRCSIQVTITVTSMMCWSPERWEAISSSFDVRSSSVVEASLQNNRNGVIKKNRIDIFDSLSVCKGIDRKGFLVTTWHLTALRETSGPSLPGVLGSIVLFLSSPVPVESEWGGGVKDESHVTAVLKVKQLLRQEGNDPSVCIHIVLTADAGT
ncbi:hypothetical protein MUK42_36304 [Musa troglodytarum]|uniref:Uncharacterized protein n=1 Tax=Musa troglodytarum TaxID=320322 RepID=A0A9E7K9Z0_9LILI|nr:hypothetical protein MUK42_36304 [Musa troglodytarum]